MSAGALSRKRTACSVFLAGSLSVACTVSTGPARAAEPLQPTAVLPVTGAFAGEEKGEVATDLSGIACLPAAGSGHERRCLVVNDQNRSAQFATITGGSLTAGEQVPLLGASPPTDAVGKPPATHGCIGGTKKFKDLDGEGVAVVGNSFVVVGSHGCSRNDAEYRASSFLVVRLTLNDQGQVGRIERSYRLSDALVRAGDIREYFAKPLTGDAAGLNIEGIAVLGDQMLLGLRAPSIHEEASIVSVPLEAVFAAGENVQIEPRRIAVPLGRNVGIRDMTILSDGRLLVLAGPTLEQEKVLYSLHIVNTATGEAKPLGTLATVPDAKGKSAKAEAVLELGSEAGQLRLLVLFDGIENGGPREYRVPAHAP